MTVPHESPAIEVEVVYAEPQRAIAKTLRLNPSATVGDVLRLMAADPDFAGIDVQHHAVGVFGIATAPSQVLKHRDRLELYRPLAADPKNARRSRVREARKRQ